MAVDGAEQVYGVGKAGFPLKISLRLQEPGMMICDDLFWEIQSKLL